MINVTRQPITGALEVSAFVHERGDGTVFLHSSTFYGYTKREAARIYRSELNDLGLVIDR